MAPSCVDVGCPDGGVCDAASGDCRDPLGCSQIDCVTGQLCQESTADTDAQCLAECIEGMVWNAVDGVCEVIPPNCREDWDNSILASCHNQLRQCEEWEDGAACGQCFAGYRDDGTACVAVVECADLNCAAEHRHCVAAGPHSDAYCGSCVGGYSESFGQCVQVEGATCDPQSAQSILLQCAEAYRECVEGGDGAACGGCVEGYVENPATGACEVERSCSELNCEAVHRACAVTHNAQCTDCLDLYAEDPATGDCVCIDGYLPDENGQCEPIRTCADIGADCTAAGQYCIEATATHHAYCRQCFEDQAWYEHWETCLPCPPCTLPGETGRVYPITTLMGHCVCETQQGYYHSESGLGGTVACDADGDGWISADARTALEAVEGSAERENARCDLRKIDRFVLVNESGEATEVPLSEFTFLWDAVPLYEPVNRDRPDKLIYDYDYTHPLQSNYAPPLGDGDVYLSAGQLNPLTKACAASLSDGAARYADFNANDVADVEEQGLADTHADPETRIFSMFSYFIELHRGWYEHPEGEPHGRWVIQERGRGLYTERAFRIPLTYGHAAGHWRNCHRFRDTAFDPDGPFYTMDFAAYGANALCDWSGGPDSFCGMNHHSQFKCLLVTDSADPQHLHHQTTAEIEVGYEANICTVKAGSAPLAPVTPGVANPFGAELECSVGEVPASGQLIWGAVRYRDYGDPDAQNDAYVRGCVNECAENDHLPPHARCQGPPGPPSIECNGLESDFGRLFCYRPLDTVDITPLAGESYLMGSPSAELGRYENETQQVVTFEEVPGLEVTTTEITQDQFSEFMGFNPSRFDCGNSICPVEQVTVYEAMAFANKLSIGMGYPPCYDFSGLKCFDGTDEVVDYDYENEVYVADYCAQHGGIEDAWFVYKRVFRDDLGYTEHSWECTGFRLPSEQEWEYLARATTTTPFYNGDISVIDCGLEPNLDSIGWYCGNSGSSTAPCGAKTPNAFGLYDTLGNVWEWTITARDGSDNVDGIWYTVINAQAFFLRGGAWNRGALDSRAARRFAFVPYARNHAVGFRVVRSLWAPDRLDRYVYVDNPVTWSAAEADCVSRGGHLVSIGSDHEHRLVAQFVRRETAVYDNSLWIGFSDSATEGTWSWSDGSGVWVQGSGGVYTNWDEASLEPDGGTAENCAGFWVYDLDNGSLDTRAWWDWDCNALRGYVCELD
jgi:formylglycine-generating enzyme required for sulfatase activity